ncbi:hypothetical protein [Nocardioides litoris]|uniref:hypothetical protein n=1 Tax=Nocardioides litoris TaxID=1926648 RepID=UPI001121EE71|nr:hypothetical protein [Nocardioides litoris]
MDLRRTAKRVITVIKQAGQIPVEPPGWAADTVHGPVLVTPVEDGAAPYRVESQALGVLLLHHDQRTVHAPGLVGHVVESTARNRRAEDDWYVQWEGRTARLRHTGAKRAELVLDGARLARFRRTGSTNWCSSRSRTEYTVQWEQPVPAGVALLGHALASRYGVGAEGAFLRFAEGL